ncbi:MAG: SRPBCC family protein [Deltaproteobacteria bacterium]|nr:SRPBCC family protein [Deltaproteobacteria bacterium]
MKTVSVTKRIRVPVQVAWDVIRTGAHMDRWVPAITRCEVEGSGVGARRVCVVDDHEMHESIETVDDPSRLFQYRIQRQAMLPVRNVLGTLHLAACGAEETEVLWFVNFDLDDEAAWAPVRDGIEAIYRAGIDGLEAYARRETIPS